MQYHEIGYGSLKQDSEMLARLSQWSRWPEVVAICEKPTSIDTRMQSVVFGLLQDPVFKESWEWMKAYYGNSPTIRLKKPIMTSVRECIIDTPEKDDSGATFSIVRSPEIVCCDSLFPVLPTLNLVTHIFALHTNSTHSREPEEDRNTLVTIKTLSWILRNSRMLHLATVSENSGSAMIKISPSHQITVSYSPGKQGYSKLSVTDQTTLVAAMMCRSLDRQEKIMEVYKSLLPSGS